MKIQKVIKHCFCFTEYLLGETILVAPVLEVGKYHRDIYLPIGSWKDGNSGTIYEGKSWLRHYSAPLSLLPYFIRQNIMPSLLDDFEPDKLIQQIHFQNSKLSMKIEQRNSDNMIFLNVFNDDNLVQNIKLGTDYVDHPLKVSQIPNGYEISTDHNLTHISFTIDIDDEDFSVLNIRRNLTNTNIAMDCFELGI